MTTSEVSRPREPMPPEPAAPSLRRRWFTMVTLGELLGFTAPATAGTLTAHAGPVTVAALMLLAGAIEGSVLGLFQGIVLRTVLSHFRIGRWVAATAAAAVVAWSLGLVPMLYGDQLGRWPVWAQVPAVAVGALVMVFSIGVAQFFVLRAFTDRASLWIWANAAAWIAGLTAFMLVATPLWQPGQAPALVMAIGVLAGLVMAATMAAVTGAFLLRVLADGHVPPPRALS